MANALKHRFDAAITYSCPSAPAQVVLPTLSLRPENQQLWRLGAEEPWLDRSLAPSMTLAGRNPPFFSSPAFL